VLITFDSLRADAVGGLGGRPGLMPNLEKVVQEADWAGRGIAASSWGVPAMASLFTGLQPWQHQVIEAGQARLPPELVTLPEALAARGYTAAGYWTNRWCSEKQGYAQGFDVFENLGRGHRAAERLEHLGQSDGGRQLIWMHIPEPSAPYVRHDELIPRLGPGVPDVLPRRIAPEQLQPFNDPAKPLPLGRWRRISAMYRLNAARADDRLGRLLAALRASGQWDRTLLVITSDHGEDLGENGQVLHGSNLGRWTLEVPLVIKLPRGSALRIAEPKGRRVAVDRLWATLVEAAGGTPPPAVAPSLFRPAAAPILSELYLVDSSNLFSLVDGDEQLLWEARFGPPEPAYYSALEQAGRPGAAEAAQRLGESPAALFARLAQAFAVSPPLSGIAAPGWTLEHWDAQGRSRPVNDPQRARELARRLARSWHRFTPDELTPAEERLEWTAVPDRGGHG
jgi:arylsulfatase A-like enzyme